MSEDPDSLVRTQVRGRTVTYYLASEDELRAIRGNSILADVFTSLAAILAAGAISTLLTQATAIQLAPESTVLLRLLLYSFSGVAAVVAVLAAVFHWRSFDAARRVRDSGVVRHLGGPTAEPGADEAHEPQVPAEPPSAFEILKAEYWTNKARLDVTAELRELVVDGHLDIKVTNQIACDPDKGTPKILTITYRVDGIEITKEFPERAKVSIP